MWASYSDRTISLSGGKRVKLYVRRSHEGKRYFSFDGLAWNRDAGVALMNAQHVMVEGEAVERNGRQIKQYAKCQVAR